MLSRRSRAAILLLAIAGSACGGDRSTTSAAETPRLPAPSHTRLFSPSSEEPSTPAPSVAVAAPAPTPKPVVRVESKTSAPTAAAAAPKQGPLASGEGAPRPKVGRYTTHSTGSRAMGPGATPAPFEEAGTLDIAISGDEGAYRSQTPGSVSESTYRFAREGLYLVRNHTQSGLFTFDEGFDPPQLVVRWPVHAGDHWSGSYKSDQYQSSGSYAFQVLREETVTAAGRSLPALVIEGEITSTGQLSGKVRTTGWYSPDLGLSVKRTTDVDGNYQGYPVKSHTEYVITATP